MQKNSGLSRVVVLTWLSVWLLAVPLFHVHPEVDHVHGKVGHIHGGTIHTVFSGDLDCEFCNHSKTAARGVALSERDSQTTHEHPEFGFSLLTDVSDRKSFKSLGAQAAFAAAAVRSVLQESCLAAQELAPDLSSTLFVHDRPSRAPPFLLV